MPATSDVYDWVVTDNQGRTRSTHGSVTEAFETKRPLDAVLLVLKATGFRVRVSRPG